MKVDVLVRAVILHNGGNSCPIKLLKFKVFQILLGVIFSSANFYFGKAIPNK